MEDIDIIFSEAKDKYKYAFKLDISKFKEDELAPDYAVYRLLTRGEFNSFIGLDNFTLINKVISLCVIYPKIDEYEWNAGIDELLYNAIISSSGFASEEELVAKIEKYRKYATTLEAIMTMYICKAFPIYKPSDIDEMCLDDIVLLASLSEQVLNTEIPYLELLHPETVKPKSKGPTNNPQSTKHPKNPRLNVPDIGVKKEIFVDKNNFDEVAKLLDNT